MTTNSRIRTPDLYWSATLLALGARLTATDREGHRVHFYFDGVDPDWANQWLMGTLQVGAKQLCDAVKQLKSYVHGEG